MSDHIPFELQENIMKRLPVKSLIRFRCVSKAWKVLIDSPEFIYAHSVHHSHSHRLLVGYVNGYSSDKTFVSIVDDDTFPRQKIHLTVPLPVKRLKASNVVGSSHGLFCLSGCYEHPGDSAYFGTWKAAVLWNPSIRKAIAINLPPSSYSSDNVIGFGVCSVTRDPKILLSSTCRSSPFVVRNEASITRQLKVFKLSSGAWQTTTINLPYRLPRFSRFQLVLNGFIYWLVSDRTFVEGVVDRTCSLIVSFDLGTDEFKEVHLPESLALKPVLNLFISKLRDSLAVIDFCLDSQRCDVWKMDDCFPNLFTKIFTYKLPTACINRIPGFKYNGEPVLEMPTFFHGLHNHATLGFYNPVSKHIHYSWVFGYKRTFSAYSYIETLLLLDQKSVGYCFDTDMDESDDFELSTMDGLSVE